jgi:Chaperone of endosialidase
MKTCRGLSVVFLVGLCAGAVAGAQEDAREAIPNWQAPPFWLAPASGAGAKDSGERTTGSQHVRALDIATSPLPFIAITPCRVADTRGNGFSGAYGPPGIAADTTRTFVIFGQCGIPASAAAVSFNFAALDVFAAGDLRVFPAGSSVPLVSTLNYNANTPNIANAAAVPLGTIGAITVQADATTINLIIDVNGYYGGLTADLSNLFLGSSAGNSTMTGAANVGIGADVLFSLVGGGSNTAVGIQAQRNNLNGFFNTAVGSFALVNNISADSNVAIGFGALGSITSSTSIDNIAVGTQAASNLTSGAHNIHIGNPALSSESNTIRIGSGGTHTKFFVAGVRDVTTGQANAVPVVIDGNAQLGTLSSSARVKREIADIGEESSALLKLRPVSFFYRSDSIGFRQYGLIAEEVAEVMPDLVQYSEAGEPEMVRWHFLPPLLLKALQKQQATIAQQNAVIAGLEARLARLEARLPTESGP